MKFPHQILIESHHLKVDKLPSDLKRAIGIFDDTMEDFETAENENDDEEVKELKVKLKRLSNEISFEILEHVQGEELGEDDELPKDKEGILEYLYEHGIRSVTKKQLKEYGYPVGFWSSFPIKGEVVGNYEVFRNNANEEYYKIRKLKGH